MKPEWKEQGLVMCGQCKHWTDKKVLGEGVLRDSGRCQHGGEFKNQLRDIVELGCDKWKYIKEKD